jgi:thiamine-monophosphate kinase
MSEFNLIRDYFTRPTTQTMLGIGDDAALISLKPGMELAISADMLVAGTHFFIDADPYNIGWKSLAVNLSDMAAIGADAKWATLAIALPNNDTAWLSQFSAGFFACAAEFNVDLIGGDTTRGPLTISVQIMGEVPAGLALKRSGAKPGDEVWVSGRLGDAALALAHKLGQLTLPAEILEQCASALDTPQPRINLGLALRGLAHSAIDISDGLAADLGHILTASKLGAELQLSAIPHTAVSSIADGLKDRRLIKAVLAGGDDYELCFSAPVAKHEDIMLLGQQLGLALTVIGHITEGTQLIVRGLDQQILDFKETGFDHFS